MDAQQRLCGSEATRGWLAKAQTRKGEDWVSILHELIPKIPLPPDAELHLVTTAAPAGGFVTKVEGLSVAFETAPATCSTKNSARREAAKAACVASVDIYPRVQLLHKLVIPCPWKQAGNGRTAMLRPDQLGEHWIMAHRDLFRQSVHEGPEQIGELTKQVLLDIFQEDVTTATASAASA